MNTPTDSQTAPTPIPLDAAALARLRELDPEGRNGVLERVLKAFESSLGRMVAQLQAERVTGHADVVSSVAHTLKSSAASVGALPLSRACAEVEKRLRSGEPGDLPADIERLLVEANAALSAVKAMLRP
jgi:HPt (histidine-containing phosphotransfer) domain-containing protein